MRQPQTIATRAPGVRIDLLAKRSALLLMLVGIWWLLSLRYPHYVLPGPLRVWDALSLIIDNGDLWRNLAVTLKRVCIGFGLERIALALFKTHGLNTGSWPDAVRAILSLD